MNEGSSCAAFGIVYSSIINVLATKHFWCMTADGLLDNGISSDIGDMERDIPPSLSLVSVGEYEDSTTSTSGEELQVGGLPMNTPKSFILDIRHLNQRIFVWKAMVGKCIEGQKPAGPAILLATCGQISLQSGCLSERVTVQKLVCPEVNDDCNPMKSNGYSWTLWLSPNSHARMFTKPAPPSSRARSTMVDASPSLEQNHFNTPLAFGNDGECELEEPFLGFGRDLKRWVKNLRESAEIVITVNNGKLAVGDLCAMDWKSLQLV
ncbi:hypothetical protein BV22DRAFT_1050926 [Leucogyrophana mollusca]|uniref:Uncharacterized protein n=1 Tax=Leucogyrophana mollusca TaxID=85980 RepID=A0ACB8B4F6_9AGAM|nr:hypothetical protein BV22DRAFT_1050926 [Leucogyrophana mollusca]